VFDAVSVCPWVGVPAIETLPVGRSLTLAMEVVATLVTLSTVPQPSRYDAFTEIAWPSSVTATPEGVATAFFPIRDMIVP
jgi:hypothetical protein